MKNRLREELEAMLELRTGDSFTADNVHTLVNGIFAADGGGFKYVEYDNDAFPYPQTIGSTALSISGLGPADESMINTIFIMPNKGTDPTATMMIVVDEKEPSTDPKTYQYVYVGNINDLPSDVLTEESIVDNLTTERNDKPLSANQGRTLNSHVNYTTCGSNASDEVKLISDNGFELSTHLRLLVLMTNTNTNSTPKFNINNTGIKDVWYNGSVASDTNTWSAGEVLDVYYDGTKYVANTHGSAQLNPIKKILGADLTNLSESLIWNVGYISGSNVTTTDSAYNYSNPISVKKGTVINFESSNNLSSGRNALTKAIINGDNITYERLFGFSTTWKKYVYIITEDCYVVFNKFSSSSVTTEIYTLDSDTFARILDTIPQISKLNEIKEFLGTDLINLSQNLNWANTGYIRGTEPYAPSSSSYKFTNPIQLTKGTVIKYSTPSNLSYNVNALTKAIIGDTTTYEPLVKFTRNWNTYIYVLTEDCYVVFNKSTSDQNQPTIDIYKFDSLGGIYTSLPKAMTDTDLIPAKDDLNVVLGTENLENILDSLNLTWTNGRYVYYNRGTSVANNEVRVFNEPTGNYCYSNIFKVTKGTIIQWNQNASAFGRLNVPIVGFVVVGDDVSTATNRYGLLKLDTNTSSSFRWTAPDDLYISICVRNDAYTSEYLKIYKSTIGADTIQTTLDSYVKFPKIDYMDLMSQATRVDTYNGTNSEFGSGYERTQVTLLHFSDIHNDIPRIFRVLNFNSKYNTIDHYIDGIIMTGDLVGEKYGVFDDSYYQTIPNFNKVMLAIGNHDVYDADDLYSRPGICSTASGTAAKEVDVSYGTDRTVFTVKMNNVNTATNPTLNISGTGAKPLYYNGSAASSSNSWSAGSTLVVVDNETYYDSYSQGYDSVYLRATEKQKYDRYMANISSWGVVQPTGAGQNDYYPCYYYKDYTTNRVDTESPKTRYNQNVRLIVVDATIQSGTTDYTTQLNWFADVLADANTNGFHVVVAEHYAPRTSFVSTNHMRAGGFDCLIDEWGENPAGSRLNNFCNAVDSFITEGGNFVCWLCGHFHWDMVGTTTQHPKQLFIAVGSADTVSPMQHRARIVGEQSEDLFNIVAIDTFRKHVRVFRVGAQFDRFLQHAGTMCISYDSSGEKVPTLLSSW